MCTCFCNFWHKCIRKLCVIWKYFFYLQLRRKNITIISNNCIAGYIYNNFGLKFLSPTINVQIKPDDFIKFCENLDSYISEEIIEVKNPDDLDFKALGGGNIDFPVGKIKDITIYFQHYESFKCGVDKWNERKKRINHSQLFFILCDTYCNGKTVCDKKIVNDFLSIPYKNKLFVTDNVLYKNSKNCCYIDSKGDFWYNINPKIKKRYFFVFDFKKWFLSKN